MRPAALATALVTLWAPFAAPPALGDDAAQPSANALYDAAFDRWRALPLPPFAAYRAHGVATRRGHVKEWKDDVWYRESDGRCTTVGVALDAGDRPDPPEFGARCFSPRYSFTFVPQRNGSGGGALPMDVPAPEPGAGADLKTIGSVSVRARPYEVTFEGDESVDGTAVAHLSLRPYGDPSKHILRDVWIDRATNGVVRLRGEATASAHLIRLVFDAFYDESESEQSLRRIVGYGKAQLLLVKVGADFTYALEGLAYPDSLPDWYFDRRAYFAHGGIPPP